jgi:aspartyl-tRNA synthetase
MRTLTQDIIKSEGQDIELYGWVHARRDHGKIIFIDLRDRTGLVQVVFSSGGGSVSGGTPSLASAQGLRLEYVIKVSGLVKKRPDNMVNDKLPNGYYEIEAKELEILNASEATPISIDSDGYEISEEVRLRYRYLDLRRERLTRNLLLRHRVVKFMRDFLDDRGFIEIETPILSKSTPEGARDYLVPSRLSKGNFYALPQSPQQYKQLLMIAGFEKYFQIARCFRDEDTRGDRQPEFTQLDLEMSFATQEEILNLVEELYINLIGELLPEHHISQIPFPRIPYSEAMGKYKSDKPDLRKDKNDSKELAFAFIIDFPMFEWNKDDKRWYSAHHPFTMMKSDDLEYLESDELDKIKAESYDLVLNGYEMASGSIRINEPDIQSKVFKALGLTDEEVMSKFGHMIEAFKYGAPPHGGIAPGIDRFIMILANEPNIREVIAFPKTGEGYDPMMGSPSKIDKKQLDDIGLQIKKS